MNITTNHPQSSYGIPVILSDDGNPLDYAGGVKALRARLNLSRAELAAACNVSHRTVEAWEQGRLMVDAAALNVMGDLLKRKPRLT